GAHHSVASVGCSAGAHGANPGADARGADAGHVVDDSVAVVVDGVAHLGGAPDAASAGAGAHHAGGDSRHAARPGHRVRAVGEAASGTACAVQPCIGQAVVYCSVTVVVLAIAHFGH